MQIKFELLENGEFTKVFQMEDTKMFIHQRFEEESDTYYLLCAIPSITLNGSMLQDVQLPIPIESKEEMQNIFKDFDNTYANNLFARILAQIVSNENNSKDDNEPSSN
ncbi:MAG: hypothetical protein EBR55_05525 [Chitinophagia bacterium]|nr:hypothetical protein [Chitinophagia bacterium]